ncbi:MAG: hypothetical protein WKG07_24275 [Hymenobacter sp.]
MRVVNRVEFYKGQLISPRTGRHAAGPHHGPQVPEFLAPAGRDEQRAGPRRGVLAENRHPAALRRSALRALHHDERRWRSEMKLFTCSGDAW